MNSFIYTTICHQVFFTKIQVFPCLFLTNAPFMWQKKRMENYKKITKKLIVL